MKKIGGCFVLACYAHNVLATTANHSINWWHLGAEYKNSPALGWLTITFIIFVYFVAKAVKKPLSLYLETRSKDIERKIEEGRLAKIESEKKLKMYDEKLRTLSEEIEKLKQNFRDQAEAEKIERNRAAKEIEARILRDTDEMIRANRERAKNRLVEEAISHAVMLAEQTISAQKTNDVDNALRDNFLVDLHDTAADVKRGYVMNEFVKTSVRNDLGPRAGEVH